MQTTMSLRDRILAIRAERECNASGLPTSSWQFRIKGVKARCPMCNVSDHSGIVAGRKRLVHCRFCGRLVCEDCSRGREEAAGYDDETMTVATNKLKLFRICDNCLDTNTTLPSSQVNESNLKARYGYEVTFRRWTMQET